MSTNRLSALWIFCFGSRTVPSFHVWLLACLACLAWRGPGIPTLAQEDAPNVVDPASNVFFSLDKAVARPGDTARLTLSVSSAILLKAVTAAINFDESKVQVLAVKRLPVPGLPQAPADERFSVDYVNSNREPGNQSEEGWIVAKIDSMGSENLAIAVGEEKVPIAEIEFQVLADAPFGFSPVTFEVINVDGPQDALGEFVNAVEPAGADSNEVVPILEDNLRSGGLLIGDVVFSLDRVVATPGENAKLRLSVFSSIPLRVLTATIKFQEAQLQVKSVEPLIEGTFTREFADGQITLSFESADRLAIPEARRVPIAEIEFQVDNNAQLGFSPVSFDSVTFNEEAAPPGDGDVPLPAGNRSGGGVTIIGEIGFFMRGDSNFDLSRDIADPVYSLSFLFTGGPVLICHDAGDANDDGLLDVSDSIFTLTRLFTSPAPFPEPDKWGKDPSPDHLGCDLAPPEL